MFALVWVYFLAPTSLVSSLHFCLPVSSCLSVPICFCSFLSDHHLFMSMYLYLSVEPGVYSTSSQTDDSDDLYGRSFNRCYYLWQPVRQVRVIQIFLCAAVPGEQETQTIVTLSFRFGRKSVLIWSYLQLGVLGCSSALSPSYFAYCVFRFLSGMAVSGIILNGFSLSTCPIVIYLLLCFLYRYLYLVHCLPVCPQRWNGSQPNQGH